MWQAFGAVAVVAEDLEMATVTVKKIDKEMEEQGGYSCLARWSKTKNQLRGKQ